MKTNSLFDIDDMIGHNLYYGGNRYLLDLMVSMKGGLVLDGDYG